MNKLDCSDKKFLIVENIKQSRDTLKLFAYSVGAVHVDITHRASNVISMCEYSSYDIIFLGYDLGENKKNGQQILEELRTKRLISRHCIIIMITAEVSQAMVLAALEHKPDEYLAKPYTLKDIKSRLHRSLVKKVVMGHIYHAMDEENHAKVLELANIQIAKNSAYKSECLGIISRQYFELQQYDKAAEIYEEYKDKPNCQWARIGLGKIALENEDFQTAQIHFQTVIDQYPLYLSAYDWLAKALEQEGQTHSAEQILEEAIFISPRSVGRLKKYAQLCVNNEKYGKAADAYSKSHDLSHNSIHKGPETAILFAEALLEYSDDLDSEQTHKLTGKAHKALNTMTKEFQQPDFKIISNLLSSRLFLRDKSPALANPLMESAVNLIDQHKQELTNQNTLTISSSLLSLDKGIEAQNLLNELALSNPDDTNLLARIEEVGANPITDKDKQEAQMALELGIKLFKEKSYIQAIDKLNQALKLFPSHIGIKLNLLQALIVALKAEQARTQDNIQINEICAEFDALELSTTNETMNRYTKLKKNLLQIREIKA